MFGASAEVNEWTRDENRERRRRPR